MGSYRYPAPELNSRMTVACEECYPEWGNREVLTIAAQWPCEFCESKTGNHVFRRAPYSLWPKVAEHG